MNPITVLLAEDHTIVREGFRTMLELEPDLKVVGEARDGLQAVAKVKELRPDIVLMDIAMPTLNGLEATRRVIKARPATKVIVLSAHNDDAYVNGALASGARGFLLKQISTSEVCRAIRVVQSGHTFFSPSVSARLSRLLARATDRKHSGKKTHLTTRGMEVLQLVAEGKSNKEIAAALSISIKTVEKHRQGLMEKLDIHDTAGLTRYAIATGIIECSVQVTIIEDELEMPSHPPFLSPLG